MTVSNGAYQHHQEEMNRQYDLSRERAEESYDGEYQGDSKFRLIEFFPFGIIGAFAMFMELHNYFDTSVTWELCALILSMVIGWGIAMVVAPIVIYGGLIYLFFYCLYHLIVFFI